MRQSPTPQRGRGNRIVEITGVDRVIPIYASLEEALT
jgi:hypothetical protein